MHSVSHTDSIRKIARRMSRWLLDFLATDMTETKYGHRVLDQIFREGKFAGKSSDKSRKNS